MRRIIIMAGLVWLGVGALVAQPPAPAAVRLVHFNLSGSVSEVPASDPFNLSGDQSTSLKGLVEKLDKVREDANIKGVVLTWSAMQVGLAQAEEIRAALARLKQAGKPVFVHLAGDGGMLTINPYAMLSAATAISVEPQSDIWITGLSGEQLYLKDALAKLGITADWIHMGAYKSAGEMFTNTGPSPEADKMMNWIFDGLYEGLVNQIADGRGMKADEVRALIDKGPYSAEEALKVRLVDKVEFQDEFLAGLKEKFGDGTRIDNRYEAKSGPKLDLSNPFALMNVFSQLTKPEERKENNAIAIVYVDGMILSGHGDASPFGGNGGIAYGGDVNYWLMKAGKDPSVKAVVLRIDSPGGSALGSEQIWRATQEVRKLKPVVASMGNVAASGGYYSACGTQAIYADNNTITASIGVVGGKFVTTEMWQKLGVNWVAYQRGANAGLFDSRAPFTPEQRKRMEEWMGSVYARFQEHVKEGRGDKLKKPMEELNGGRVFTGAQAKELGLVDEIGGLDEAVAAAAKLANLTNYDTRVVPTPKDFITQIVESIGGTAEKTSDLSVTMGTNPAPGSEASAASINGLHGLGADPAMAAMQKLIGALEPAQAAAFHHAIQNLMLLRAEGAAVVMPFELVVH